MLKENKDIYIFKIFFHYLFFDLSYSCFQILILTLGERREGKSIARGTDTSKTSTESHETTAIAGNSRNEGGYVG